METSFFKNLEFNDNKPAIKLMLETPITKEIRITFLKGQKMNEHQAPKPILVQVLEGAVEFGVFGQIKQLEKGDLIALEANVPHDLYAKEESVVRLSLSKSDSVSRVNQVVD